MGTPDIPTPEPAVYDPFPDILTTIGQFRDIGRERVPVVAQGQFIKRALVGLKFELVTLSLSAVMIS